MAVSVDGVVGNGTVLVDTGINYMFLSPPDGTRLERGRRASVGGRITVFMPDQRNPQPAYYGFTVGARGNPMHPERVEVVHDRLRLERPAERRLWRRDAGPVRRALTELHIT